ncbi:general odorant-binding protein 56h-like [Ceratitis capitata]|uniref:general odorant-binding protein 56h-like n=1 Tax=Ceratitis capitata TaxID=7213 RepID=UPI0006188128|nr:general odorant-binding protein 56h-like [Ceratitis capitata]
MKSYFALTLFVISCAVVMCHPPPDPEMRKYIDECTKDHNVTPKEFHEFMEGKAASPSENLKCSSHCVMLKQGIIDEAGNFKPDVAKSKMPDDKLAAAIDDCKDLSGSSACDTAFKITECVLSHK